MRPPFDDASDPTPSPIARPSGPVPQEHNHRQHSDTLPRDWSQLGRQVLAEAWRRTTDAIAARQQSGATPVVPAPNPELPQ